MEVLGEEDLKVVDVRFPSRIINTSTGLEKVDNATIQYGKNPILSPYPSIKILIKGNLEVDESEPIFDEAKELWKKLFQ